jgi:hypothetical protein
VGECRAKEFVVVVEGIQDAVGLTLKVVQIVRNEIGQPIAFCMLPALFHGIQLGGIPRQPLELKPIGTVPVKIPGSRLMDAPTIPDEYDLAAKMAVHLGQQPNQILGGNVFPDQLKVKGQATPDGRVANSADAGKTVVPVPSFLDRCLALQSPSPTANGLKHHAEFIEKYQC